MVEYKRQQLVTPLCYLTLSLSVLLAWRPILTKYYPVAEDYLYSSQLMGKGLMGYFELNGLYRIVGHSLVIIGTMGHPLLFGILSVFTHIVTVCLFFEVCQRMLGSVSISFTISLFAAIFPWAYQCMVWIPAYAFALATAFFWANVLIFSSSSFGDRNQNLLFLITYCLTWLSLLCFEGLFFSLAICGFVLWIPRGEFNFEEVREKVKKFYAGWAPFLACLSYIASYVVARHFVLQPPQKTLVWNPESIFSVYFHQWSNIHLFQPWLNPGLRKFIFFEWSEGRTTATVGIFILFAIGLSLLTKHLSNENSLPSRQNKSLLLYIVTLLIGASFIYALGGGYSLDNRKKYPLVFLLFLLLGWVWRNFFDSKIKISQKNLPTLFGLCILGISTTWLNTGIWRYEASRYNSLINFLVTHNIAGDIHVEWQPDLYEAWPTLVNTWGSRMDEDLVLNAAIHYKGGQPVHVVQNVSAKTVRFDGSSSQWKLVT